MLEIEKTIEMTYPYNLPDGELQVKKIRKLIRTAKELGGTMYDVAAESGLLEAWHHIELLFDPQVSGERIFPDDMTVVTEAYVRYPLNDELERIFLYSENASWDNKLLQAGTVEDGKLVISYENLKSVREKGYYCLYELTNNTRNKTDRFTDCFGSSKRKSSFRFWDEDYSFVGNGFNRALLVRTKFGELYLMPDIFAVEQCMKVFYAETIIREKYDANFSAERMKMDEKAEAEKEAVFQKIFHRKMESCQQLKSSYCKLVEQIAYIKVHYSSVYDTVWEYVFYPDDEPGEVEFDPPEDAVLGISIDDSSKCYAVCRMENGDIKRVINTDYSDFMPLTEKYCHWKFTISMISAGKAGSELALNMKQMIRAAKQQFNVNIKKMYVTSREELPDNKRLTDWIGNLQKRREKSKRAEGCLDLIAFREIGNDNIDGLGVIKWAAELAGVPEVEYVDDWAAVLAAFEAADKNAALKEQETGLIFDFDESILTITLLRKKQGGDYELISRKHGAFMEVFIYDNKDVEDGGYNPSLHEELGNALENFMMDKGLRALGISPENEIDEQALADLRQSAARVKRQFRRNDTAKVIFNNGYLSMMEDYPIEQFEKCFSPVLENVSSYLCEVVEQANLRMEDISKVYLTGEECEYPFVRERIEKITGKKAYCLSPFDCVDAIGVVSL